MLINNEDILNIIEELESLTKKKFPEQIKEEITNSFLCFEEEPELLFEFKLAYTKANIKINGESSTKPIKCIYRHKKSYDIYFMDGTFARKQNVTVEFKNLTPEEFFNIFKKIKNNKRKK